MENKVCCRCKVVKNVDEFYKDKTSKSGYKSHCKSCEKIYLKSLSERQKDTPKFKTCSRCKETKPSSEFCKYAYTTDGLSHKCKSCTRDVFEVLKTKPKRVVDRKTCSICHKTKPIDDFYKSDVISDGHQSCCKSCTNKRNKNRSDSILNVRLANNLRSRVRSALKDGLKPVKTMIALGCTIEFFKKYIEAQFEPWMTWENWGFNTWHLDHKIPLAQFDLSNGDEFLKACHYTNYQPLPAKANLRKNRFVDRELTEGILSGNVEGIDLNDLPLHGRPVMCVELSKLFKTSVDAARYFGRKDGSNIRKAIERNGAAYGYHWRYATESDLDQPINKDV